MGQCIGEIFYGAIVGIELGWVGRLMMRIKDQREKSNYLVKYDFHGFVGFVISF